MLSENVDVFQVGAVLRAEEEMGDMKGLGY